jgi:hypothetical protein
VSDVVQSSFGFHLIRRPPKDRPGSASPSGCRPSSPRRPPITGRPGEEQQHEAQPNAEVRQGSGGNVDHARKNGQKLATYRGGAFTVADFALARGAGGRQPPDRQHA